MKKIILFGAAFLTLISCIQNKSAGEFLGEGENNGKKYVLGNDTAVNVVLNVAKHYSAKDTDEMFKYSTALVIETENKIQEYIDRIRKQKNKKELIGFFKLYGINTNWIKP